MNKFVVFALLAVCAFADSLFPAFEYRERNVRDTYELTPAELPCAYEIIFIQNATVFVDGAKIDVGTSFGAYLKHGPYFKLQASGMNLLRNHTMMEELYRPDITNGTHVFAYRSRVTLGNRTIIDSQCEKVPMTESEMTSEINRILKVFVEKTTHQGKQENVQFDGQTCTAYSDAGENPNYFSTLYVNDKGYIIGANYTREFEINATGSGSASGSAASGATNKVWVEMIAHLQYRHFATRRSFTMRKNFTDCHDDAVYVPPTQALCFVTYEPAKLPCAYVVKMTQTSYLNGTEFGTADATLYAHSDYHKFVRHEKSGRIPEHTEEMLFRPDLLVEGGNITFFHASKNATYSYCESENLTLSDMYQFVNFSYQYLMIPTQHEYQETREYKGKQYTAYVDYIEKGFSEGSIVFYVDNKNYIIAIEINAGGREGQFKAVADVVYEFYTPVSSFVISSTVCSSCNESAYVAPNKTVCPEPPPTPSTSSTTPTPSTSSTTPTPSTSSTTPTPSGSTTSSTTPVPSKASTTTAAVAMTLLSVAVIALL